MFLNYVFLLFHPATDGGKEGLLKMLSAAYLCNFNVKVPLNHYYVELMCNIIIRAHFLKVIGSNSQETENVLILFCLQQISVNTFCTWCISAMILQTLHQYYIICRLSSRPFNIQQGGRVFTSDLFIFLRSAK